MGWQVVQFLLPCKFTEGTPISNLQYTFTLHVLLQMNYLNGLIKIDNFLTIRIGYEESKTMYGSRWWIPIKWAIEVDGILLLKSFFPFNRSLTQQEERSL